MPTGFATFDRGSRIAIVEATLVAPLRAAGLLVAGEVELRLARAQGRRGRAPTAVVEVSGRADRLLLRPVRHGGWLGPWLGGALLGLRRPLQELATTHALRRAGAPVPQPACVITWRRAGPIWNGLVGTFLISDAIDGVAFVESCRSRAELERTARAVGRALRCFHDAGGSHVDLHLKNLLIRRRDEGPEVTVIDLDRARLRQRLTPRRRMVELMRLYRSLAKRSLLERVGARGCIALFGAYVGTDRELRRALLARLPWERLRVSVHALRYSTLAPGR